MSLPFGWCPVCGHERPVDRRGRLKPHRRYVPEFSSMIACTGEGREALSVDEAEDVLHEDEEQDA